MEQRDLDAALGAGADDLLLRLVQLPVGGEAAAVLRGIRVADHHLLPPLAPAAIPGQREQLAQDVAGVAQVVDGLEQRHDPQRPIRAGLLLQQLDDQHVRRPCGHRDDVRAQRLGRQPRGRAERLEHLPHVGRRGEIGRDERAPPLQLAQQERLPVGFAPFLVGAEPQLARDGRHGLGVPRRVLAQIEAHERGAERRNASQQIAQPPRRHDAVAHLHERAVAQA